MEWTLEIVLVVLLGATLFQAVKLERALGQVGFHQMARHKISAKARRLLADAVDQVRALYAVRESGKVFYQCG